MNTRSLIRTICRKAPVSVLMTLLCVRLCGFALAGEDPKDNTLTPQIVEQLKEVSHVEISPDGKSIAYTLKVPRPIYSKDDGRAWSELHVVDLDGVSRPYVTGKVNVGSIQWTPDGRAISLLAKRNDDKHTALYSIPIDGGEAKKALEHDTSIKGYSWSPDGKRVAFTAIPKEEKESKKDKESGFNSTVFEENWRMVKVWIAFPFNKDDKAKKPRQLEFEGSASAPRFSPDGARLAVAIAPTPSVDDDFMKRRIHIVDVATGAVIGKVDTGGKLGPFTWSPDGESLALIAGVDKHDPTAGHLMVVPATGGAPKILRLDYPGHMTSVVWKSENTITYLADQGVWTVLEKILPDGSQKKTVLDSGAYSIRGFSLSKDGKQAAFVRDSPEHPGEVYALDARGDGLKRLTNSNPSLDDIRLAKQEVVQFKARDGLDLEGILIRPLDEQSGARYPLIMMVHGGPESHHRNGWLTYYSLPGQIAAAQGFASFYTNYRGSTGRGLAFSKTSQKDPAGKEFDDLVDAKEHLVNIGLVDRDKVGITGGSYGGYASAWGATALTEHYAASVMFVGISEKRVSFALSDIPEELTLVHNMGYPWELQDLFRERSPLTHFKKSRTPILIMHGDADPRVSPSNSKALYRMLKTYGKVPVRLVLFPGEGHGNRRTGSRIEYTLRQLRWMNHYLKGPGGDAPPYKLDLSELRPEEKEDDED